MVFFFLLFLLVSCGQHVRSTASFDYARGELLKAEEKLEKSSYPDTLDLAMARLAQNKLDLALNDFGKAIDAMDYFRKATPEELTATVVWKDSAAAYMAPPFEQTLARFYYAMTFLQKGDENNAAANLLYLHNHDQGIPLTSYLLALLFERRGDSSNADILYKLAAREAQPTSNTTLLVVCHKGNVPYRISYIAPVSIVSAAALELLLGVADIKPALSSLTGVAVPKLIDRPASKPSPSSLTPTVIYNVHDAAHAHLKEKMPEIAVRAAARMLLRRGVAATHRAADLSMLALNLATDADTRSWATLPYQIELTRLDLEPGDHTITLDGKSYSVHLRPGELRCLQIFQLHPNVTNASLGSNLYKMDVDFAAVFQDFDASNSPKVAIGKEKD
jgi:tetratricopeptide (TPR) repeat protein